MKYLKKFESKDYKKLAKSIQYHLRKIFTKKEDYSIHVDNVDNKIHVFFGGFIYSWEDTDEFEVFNKWVKENNIDHFISYDFTIEQAEEFLIYLKNDFRDDNIKLASNKFNL